MSLLKMGCLSGMKVSTDILYFYFLSNGVLLCLVLTVKTSATQYEMLYARAFFCWELYDAHYADLELEVRLGVMAEEMAEKLRVDEELRLTKSRETRRLSMIRAKSRADAAEEARLRKEKEEKAEREEAKKKREEEDRLRKIEAARVAALKIKELEEREALIQEAQRRDNAMK